MKRTPVYKRLPKDGKNGLTNLSDLVNKKGVYYIYENTKLVYIGSSTSNLYKTILRHFQKWSDTKQLRRVSYKNKIGRYSFTFSVRLMNRATKEAIEVKEYSLVNRYKPRDNKLNLYCSITGQDCESKVKKAAARLPKKKKVTPKKKKPKKQDLIDDVPF